jgi:DNA helicase-2/ATP-dependent DNA helicase PcrA
MPGTTIPCRYCGGVHDRAAQVRACWQERSGQTPPPPPAAGPPEAHAPDSAGQHPQIPATPIGPAGPEALGRNLILSEGDPPPAWHGCEVLEIRDAESVGDRLVDQMIDAAQERRRLVFRAPRLSPDQHRVELADPWSLDARFRFREEIVAHLLQANSAEIWDGRLGFWLADRAVALGATATPDTDALLPSGSPVWCDGGPLRYFDRTALGGAGLLHRIALEHGSLRPLGTNTTSAVLSADQLRAVCEPSGCARIIAPAGSGKTRVLTERARHLLMAWGLPPGAVCLVAYNSRAAEEMRQRSPDLAGLQIRTLNSLALAIVNGSAPFSARPQRRTIDELAVRDLLDGLVELPRRLNADPAAAWIEAMSSVRLGLRAPTEVEQDYHGDVPGLAEVFARYRSLLAERQELDFDEQIYQALELLLREPDVRAAAQRACGILLVDEFQDLTPAHVLLLRLVAGPGGAVFGVGDDDQTIYGYAGASPRWLIDFAALFPGAAEHALRVNYRCPPSVVAAADRLLRRNRLRITKSLEAAGGRTPAAGDLVVLGEPGDGMDAVAATAGHVQDLLRQGSDPTGVAVLTRVNATLLPVAVALLEAGLPVSFRLDPSWLRRSGVAAALAWLRLARSAERISGDDLRLALKRPPRGIPAPTVDRIAEQSSASALAGLARRTTGGDGPKVRQLAADLRMLSTLAGTGATAPDLLGVIRDDLGLDRAMKTMEASRRRLDGPVHTDDLDALVALGRIHPDLATFEAWLRQRLRSGSSAQGVHLSTVHPVKGREWPHVVVHGATVGLMPHRLATDIEEERRVFHVAITRGICSVAISCGDLPSPFVAELFREPQDDPPIGQPSLPARAKPAPAKPARAKPVREVAPRTGPSARKAPEVEETAVQAGQTISAQGNHGIVERIEAGGIRMRVGSALVFVPWGERITIGRTRTHLGRPTTDTSRSARAQALLRQWRTARAGGQERPDAILSDATLEAIAGALPAGLEQLAAIPGVGPGKLELFGDEILAMIAQALPDD